MARLWLAGAETGHHSTEQSVATGTVTFDTATKRTGTRSFKCDSAAGNVKANIALSGMNTPSTGVAYYLRAYIRFPALPATLQTVLRFDTAALKLTTGGKLQLWELGATPSQIGSDSSATLSVDTWYRLELALKINTGSNDDYIEGLLDGASIASSASADIATSTAAILYAGWCTVSGESAPGANKVIFVDDVALNDDTGTNQNSWPGDGGLVLLLPTSDNARATLWTGGTGGTTNLFDAVNNIPPVGTATESNTTQIEHAGGAGGTTDAYDANMTTYTAAGVPTGATIKLVQFLEADGEDVATGVKLLNFEVLSNPAISSIGDVNAGDNIGALGTFSTNWAIHRSAVLYSPSVTLGTAPVMRARRPETATRVASVCFMGIYVEFVSFTGYTLDATGSQSYAETGQAATLRAARKLIAGSGTYSMSGTAVGLKYGRKIGIGSGSFAEAGQAAALRIERKLPIGSGSFAEAGQDATLTHGVPGHILPVDSGSYSEAGQDVTLKMGRNLPALPGSYSEVGSVVTLIYAQMRRLTAEVGSYSEVGSVVTLTHGGVGYVLPVDAASYSEVGQDVVLRLARKLLATAGDFSLAGSPVALRSDRKLTTVPGSFAESGAPVALAAGRKVSAGSASYSEVGQVASLRFDRRLLAGPGSFAESGSEVILEWSGSTAPSEISDKITRPQTPHLVRVVT